MAKFVERGGFFSKLDKKLIVVFNLRRFALFVNSAREESDDLRRRNSDITQISSHRCLPFLLSSHLEEKDEKEEEEEEGGKRNEGPK